MEFDRNTYVSKLLARRGNGLVKVITGARRAGKSYLMNELFKKALLSDGVDKSAIIQFAFDTDEDIDLLDRFLPEEPTKIKTGKNKYVVNSKKFRQYVASLTKEQGTFFLLLDEVQLLDGFVSTLNGLLRHKNFEVYVTGSNSRFLSKDIETEFKGRGSVIHVMPLTFREYSDALGKGSADSWRCYI